jgi:8-oxo-dGTP pyrophosphatase MutT (NUDIX family)
MTITLAEVEDRLESHSPLIDSSPAKVDAAVAAVLREQPGGLELLFIRRAEHEDDPWSGDLALPGGRIDPEDGGPRDAAVRETLEEVALDLRPAQYLGRVSDVLGGAESIRVSAFVYAIDWNPELEPNYEIREVFWSPLAHLSDPSRQLSCDYTYDGKTSKFPAIRLLEDQRAPLLWGLTYKVIDHFMNAIGRPIPYMHWEEGGQA